MSDEIPLTPLIDNPIARRTLLERTLMGGGALAAGGLFAPRADAAAAAAVPGLPEQASALDRRLAQSWMAFCDQLKAAATLPLRPNAPAGEADRTAGYRIMARNIPLALAFMYENDHPRHPELMHYFDPYRKQGGDNTDALYVGATINGTDTYRISGKRGTARYFSAVTIERGNTPWGGRSPSQLFGHQLKVEDDGSFEIILSPTPQPGNWLRTTPDTMRVTIRQFFADWENEVPMEARIDRISGGELPPPTLDAERWIEGLAASADWVKTSVAYWADMIEKWKAKPNRFVSYRQLDPNPMDATPGGEPLISYWQLPRDEALIVRVRPPKAQYWAVEFGNYWWETMDYLNRLCNTNCHYARLEDDGELIVVVSHDDPGVPNWLDPSGFTEGYITFRWMLAESHPVPQCTQVKFAELERHLPAGVQRIDAAGRIAQIKGRRTGILRRFGYI